MVKKDNEFKNLFNIFRTFLWIGKTWNDWSGWQVEILATKQDGRLVSNNDMGQVLLFSSSKHRLNNVI